MTLLLGAGPVLFGSLLGQRMLFWQDARWFKVAYRAGELPPTIHVGEPFTVVVTVNNQGVVPLNRTSPGATHLSYHWGCPNGGYRSLADFEGLRSGLPADVPPGGTIDVVAVVRGPEAPGEYRLSWDLVQEDVSWFSARGSPTADQSLFVEPADPRDRLDSPRASEKPGDCPSMAVEPSPPPRRELWRAAVMLWRSRPLFGIGPDNFRHRYATILDPSPNGEPYSDTRLHANSLYFETLADLGLAGLLALGWIGVGLVRRLRRHWRTGYLAGSGTAVAAAAFFVHGALDYFFEFTPLLGLFWMSPGLTAAFSAPSHPKRPKAARGEGDLRQDGRPGGTRPAPARNEDQVQTTLSTSIMSDNQVVARSQVSRHEEVGQAEVQVEQRKPEGEHAQRVAAARKPAPKRAAPRRGTEEAHGPHAAAPTQAGRRVGVRASVGRDGSA